MPENRERDTLGILTKDINRAIDAILEFNDAPDRPHQQKIRISIKPVHDLTGRATNSVSKILKKRSDEIEKHHQKHNLSGYHNRSRQDAEGNDYPPVEFEPDINYQKISEVQKKSMPSMPEPDELLKKDKPLKKIPKIARVDEFLEKLKPLSESTEIKMLCNQELAYLREKLALETIYSDEGYPVGVTGDARRLKTQVSAYRNAIRELETNSKNSESTIKDGEQVKVHKALEFFNLADYEKRDAVERDRLRLRQDKINRPSFDALAVIRKALELLETNTYIAKTAGLYLLTGRRHEEILITGKFDTPLFDTEDDLLGRWLESIDAALFSGQVKLKGNEDIPYNIPILAPLEVIQEAINWLRTHKPHQPGQRPKGSKELGLKVRKEFQQTGLLPIPAGKNNYLTPHNLRSAYSAICWQLYRSSSSPGLNCTEDIFIKRIMGHREETTQSAQAYLDYECKQ